MKVNAITVSVQFADLLAVTLPRNARHFNRIVVVSDFDDHATAALVATIPNAILFQTNAFYRDGAVFRKWLALEEGLDVLGRDGWICVLDADILLPDHMNLAGARPGKLYTPRRRILADAARWQEFAGPDADWSELPINRDEEWAGYFQLFHASDPVLPAHRHWYGTDWTHAGGGDSELMERWQKYNRARPPFEVLHLGEDGKNWCGRVTPLLDGTTLPQAADRAAKLDQFLSTRKQTSSFRAEKILRTAEAVR